jgi:hypothetical protein
VYLSHGGKREKGRVQGFQQTQEEEAVAYKVQKYPGGKRQLGACCCSESNCKF